MYKPSLSIEKTVGRQENKDLNLQEFISGSEILESKPRVLFIELTRNCNFYCWMCREKTRWNKEWDMEWSLFKQIADQLLPYVEIVDLRGWGESTLLPWFIDAVEYSRSFGCQVKLYTNLSVTNEKLWYSLVNNDAWIAISFDGAKAETFQKLRKGSNFAKIISNLELLVGYSEQLGKPKDRIYLSTTVQNENLQEIPEIIKLAYNNGLGCVKLFPVICDRSSPSYLGNNVSNVIKMVDTVSQMSKDLGIPVEFGASLDESIALEEKLVTNCIHPWSHCYISPKGGVGFCDHLIGNDNYILGSIIENTFMVVWNNDKFKQLRAQHKEGEKAVLNDFRACKWCFKNRYSDIEHLIAPLMEQSIVSTINNNSPIYKFVECKNEKQQFVSGLLP